MEISVCNLPASGAHAKHSNRYGIARPDFMKHEPEDGFDYDAAVFLIMLCVAARVAIALATLPVLP